MLTILGNIWVWVKRWFSKPEPNHIEQPAVQKTQFAYEFVEDLPQRTDERTVYLVGENGFVWQIAFYCPCKCGQLIQLNALKETSPNWEYVLKGNLISLKPSVWRTVGCKSHFFLRNGNVIWHSENEG